MLTIELHIRQSSEWSTFGQWLRIYLNSSRQQLDRVIIFDECCYRHTIQVCTPSPDKASTFTKAKLSSVWFPVVFASCLARELYDTIRYDTIWYIQLSKWQISWIIDDHNMCTYIQVRCVRQKITNAFWPDKREGLRWSSAYHAYGASVLYFTYSVPYFTPRETSQLRRMYGR